MKLMVILGAILFAGGALTMIGSRVFHIWEHEELVFTVHHLPKEIEFTAVSLMVIPVVALIGWVVWRVLKKL